MRATVTNKLWSHRGEHEDKPSNHCAGKAGLLPLNLYAHVRFLFATFAHETSGAARTRSSLRPLFLGRMILQNSGECCRDNAEVCLVIVARMSEATCGTAAAPHVASLM